MSKEHLDQALSLYFRGQYAAFEQEVVYLLASQPPPTIKARLLSWSAQSFEKQQKPEEARARYIQAIEAMQQCGAHDDIPPIRESLKRVEEQIQLKTTPITRSNTLSQGIEMLTQSSPTKYGRAEMLLLSSVAKADEENDLKQRVLARLALARIPSYQETMINEAYDIAQNSNDMNLITAVKKTMDQLNITIEPKIF